MEIITIDNSNILKEHICCAIGDDKKNSARSQSKKKWLQKGFNDGLVFKRFDQRGKIFIEYMPIETVWKPLVGKNYMVINCLWVSGQFKGKGLSTKLLNECIKDAKQKKMDGIAVVSSDKVKPFLTDKKFYLKHGFKVVDSALPYFELLALNFTDAKPPKFTLEAKQGLCENKKGFTFIYSNQCPFMEEYIELLTEILRAKKIFYKSIQLESYKEAKKMGSPFGTLGIYYEGIFKTHVLMPEKKFEEYIKTVMQ